MDRVPHQRHPECAVTPEEYLGAVRAVAWRAADHLPAERLANVDRLIEHGEPAEGLCSLAWVIVSDRVQVPMSLIIAIREYTAELIDDESMPSNLDDYAVPDPPG